MRTTIALDDDLVRKAQEYTGIAERSALVREGLKALIHIEASRRLALLGGSEPDLRHPPAPGRRPVILADSSVWIDHLRTANPEVTALVTRSRIVMHPFVVAEIALGSLRNRRRTLEPLEGLRQVRVAQIGEVRRMIEAHALYSRGIGLIDAHLIASCLLTPGTRLWTRDTRLQNVARLLNIAADISPTIN